MVKEPWGYMKAGNFFKVAVSWVVASYSLVKVD
jgi:hypothetical protein